MKSDTQIKNDVESELSWDAAIGSTGILVSVRSGIVTLSGTVSTYADKFHAEHAASRVSGVNALAVEIRVQPLDPYIRSDTEIARSAETALQYVSYLPKDAVKIIVEDGWVTLSGVVDWNYQRDNVETALRYLWGVNGISNNLTLISRAPSASIHAEILTALARRTDAEEQHISVDVAAGAVTLTGSVTSWWQKELAREAAWNLAGVTHVTNNLRIVP